MAQPPKYTTGQEVIDLYCFGPKLGQGNYGLVRSCMDLYKPGPDMACKTITYSSLTSMVELEDIQREISVMTLLGQHPNIVELKGVHRDKTGWHIVMELCRGGELFDEVMKRERFTEADAADTIRQLACALEFCHSKNVLHRDIKLENILLGSKAKPMPSQSKEAVPDEEVKAKQDRKGLRVPKKPRMEGKLDIKLADFGLAIHLRRGQRVSEVAGSPFYMAPEVVRGLPYRFAADVWSMGIILYSLLSGLLPFTGPSNDHIFRAVRRAYIDLDTPSWKGVSPAAKDLVRRLLNPDPAQRPTAKEVLSDPWINSFPTQTLATKGVPQSRSWRAGSRDTAFPAASQRAVGTSPSSSKPSNGTPTTPASPASSMSIWRYVSAFQKQRPATMRKKNPTSSTPEVQSSTSRPAPKLAPSSASNLSPTSTLEPRFSTDSDSSAPSSGCNSPETSWKPSQVRGSQDSSKKASMWRTAFRYRTDSSTTEA